MSDSLSRRRSQVFDLLLTSILYHLLFFFISGYLNLGISSSGDVNLGISSSGCLNLGFWMLKSWILDV